MSGVFTTYVLVCICDSSLFRQTLVVVFLILSFQRYYSYTTVHYCYSSIEPRKGMDADFDAATAEEDDAKQSLEDTLSDLKASVLKGSGVKWFHHKTKLDDQYQLEIPQDWLSRHPSALPAGQFVSTSQTSKVNEEEGEEGRQSDCCCSLFQVLLFGRPFLSMPVTNFLDT